VTARKRFGQHFLLPVWAARIADAVGLSPSDAVIEVGPGQGVMTLALLERHAALTAIEIDRDLVASLQKALPASVQLIEGDVLRQSWVDLAARTRAWHAAQTGDVGDVRLVGNLPYNIASPLLIDLLHAARAGVAMRDAVVMVQREVADRISAACDTADYGPLAVVMQTWADVTRLMEVPPGAFRPMPKVHSTVLRLTWRPADIAVASVEAFDLVTRRVFQQRRKQLVNALQPLAHERGATAAAWLAAAELDGTRRPGTLTRPELARLAAVVAGVHDQL
jgi:16S rRNA (adenine1518-N6/adenine1519-N6)-dimethyltransferase